MDSCDIELGKTTQRREDIETSNTIIVVSIIEYCS